MIEGISNEGYKQGSHDINNNITVLATYLDDFIYFSTIFLVGRWKRRRNEI